MMFEKDWKDWCSDCVLITAEHTLEIIMDCGYSVPDNIIEAINREGVLNGN